MVLWKSCFGLSPLWLRQHIDEMLAGALTQEDEDAVLAELDAITQVGMGLNALLFPSSRSHEGQVAEDITCLKDNSVHNCDLIIKQGDDVALPEVPTQPLPQRPPEAAKAEPGTAAVLSRSSTMCISILTDAFLLLLQSGKKQRKKRTARC